jgi:hypothetical protein
MILGVGVVASGAVVATALWPPPRRRRGLEREPIMPVRAGPLTVALAFLVPLAIVAIFAASASHRRSRQTPSLPGIHDIRPARSTPSDAQTRGGADAAAALAAGLAIGLLGLLVVVAIGRHGRPRGLPDHARLVVGAGARDALAAMAIPADPRAAVLVAYARMEAAFAEAGLMRRASEAPREYLRRITERLGVSRGPTAELTGLFERARFSVHTIDEAMRRSALHALEHIAHDLEDGEP